MQDIEEDGDDEVNDEQQQSDEDEDMDDDEAYDDTDDVTPSPATVGDGMDDVFDNDQDDAEPENVEHPSTIADDAILDYGDKKVAAIAPLLPQLSAVSFQLALVDTNAQPVAAVDANNIQSTSALVDNNSQLIAAVGANNTQSALTLVDNTAQSLGATTTELAVAFTHNAQLVDPDENIEQLAASLLTLEQAVRKKQMFPVFFVKCYASNPIEHCL
jgi:hypothetical protein